MIKVQLQLISGLLLFALGYHYFTFDGDLVVSLKKLNTLNSHNSLTQKPDYQCTTEQAREWLIHAISNEEKNIDLKITNSNISSLMYVVGFISGLWLFLLSFKIKTKKRKVRRLNDVIGK